MLLRWSLGEADAAAALEAAVAAALDDGYRTRDLLPGGDIEAAAAAGLTIVGTTGMTAAIVDRIAAEGGAR